MGRCLTIKSMPLYNLFLKVIHQNSFLFYLHKFLLNIVHYHIINIMALILQEYFYLMHHTSNSFYFPLILYSSSYFIIILVKSLYNLCTKLVKPLYYKKLVEIYIIYKLRSDNKNYHFLLEHHLYIFFLKKGIY